MVNETPEKRLCDLRVADLKVELEKRSLDCHGVKQALMERLQKALEEEGHNPEEYTFTIADKKSPSKIPTKTRGSNAENEEAQKQDDEDDAMNQDEISLNPDDLVIKDELDAGDNEEAKSENGEKFSACVEPNVQDEGDQDEVVDEVGQVDEQIVKMDTDEVDENEENPDESLEKSDNAVLQQPHHIRNDSTVDNEDSLNLTIGEEDEKLLGDEDNDEKIDTKHSDNHRDLKEKCENKTNESSAVQTSSDGGQTAKKSSASTANRGGGDEKSSNDDDEKRTTGTATGGSKGVTDKNVSKLSSGDGSVTKEPNSDGTNKDSGREVDTKSSKKEDSEQKGSSLKSSKDDKDQSKSASVGSSGKSSSGGKTTTSGSRNLWVSGLSTLTRATDLKIIFSKHGKVIGAKVVTNTKTPGTRCYGYVTMSSSQDATKCIDHLHRTELHGRIISVERAKSDITMGKSPKPVTPSQKKDDDVKKSSTSDKVSSSRSDKKSETDDTKRKDSTSKDGDKKSESGRKERNISTSRTASVKSKDLGRPGGRRGRRSNDREVLSFQKIREERDRQRLRDKERALREEERRRDDIRRRQREEEQRLQRERERLQIERQRLEREKIELLRIERERQKIERQKIELERLELKRQQMKIEEEKRRAVKRPASSGTDHDRYTDVDRKRPVPDRRFEPPPPPRFDSSINSRTSQFDRTTDKKRTDDYPSSSVSKRDDYKRDDYKRDDYKSRTGDSYKRGSDYNKRDMDPPRNYDNRGSGLGHRDDNSNKERYGDHTADRGNSNSFRGSRTGMGANGNDDRDNRVNSSKSRYLDDGHHNASSVDNRYADRVNTSSRWHNAGQPQVKPFGGSSIPSAAVNDPWGQKQTDSGWRSMESSQDRYDRTYNERKAQSTSQYMDTAQRPNAFMSRPQDRYTGSNQRFDNGRF